jgi:hypothetical protein
MKDIKKQRQPNSKQYFCLVLPAPCLFLYQTILSHSHIAESSRYQVNSTATGSYLRHFKMMFQLHRLFNIECNGKIMNGQHVWITMEKAVIVSLYYLDDFVEKPNKRTNSPITIAGSTFEADKSRIPQVFNLPLQRPGKLGSSTLSNFTKMCLDHEKATQYTESRKL